MTESHIRNVIEAALLAAGKPLQAKELIDLFDEGATQPTLSEVQAILSALAEEYSTRGIELKETAAGFRIQVRPGMSNEISRLWPERPPKYSRALLETLALIAYRQPITRAEIESVRGVPVNPNIIKTIIERNWVHVVGHRDVPGRPELLATTRDFLDYFGLRALDELPALAEIKAIGEIKVQFDLPDPGAIAPDANSAEGASAGAPVDGPKTTDGKASADATASSDAVGTAPSDAVVLDAAESDAPKHTGAETVAAEANAGEHAATIEEPGGETALAEAPEHVASTTDAPNDADQAATDAVAEPANDQPSKADSAPDNKSKPTGRGSSRKKQRGKAQSSETALHEAEEFAASVDADLAGDDDASDEDELSAAGPDSTELVAGPRDIDD